jgi:hypothetical protein
MHAPPVSGMAHVPRGYVPYMAAALFCATVSWTGNKVSEDGKARFAEAIKRYPGVLRNLNCVRLQDFDSTLPLEVKALDSTVAVLDYYRDLLKGSEEVRQCRVMVLGPGGAGKTTLIHWLLCGKAPSGSVAVTHGLHEGTWQ